MGGSAVVRVLRDRTAGRCLAGVVVSGFGTSALWLTAGIWGRSLTGSNSLAALTVCAMWAPVLAGPALGALADRLPRKALLVRHPTRWPWHWGRGSSRWWTYGC